MSTNLLNENKVNSKPTYIVSLSNDLNYLFRVKTEQIDYREEKIRCYEPETFEPVNFNCGIYEHKIVEIIGYSSFLNYLAPDTIIRFKQNLQKNKYYGFEIVNGGVVNNNFTDLELKVKLVSN